jgi:phosphatidylglycerol---prolipoprotein diacylglyceryl transferase
MLNSLPFALLPYPQIDPVLIQIGPLAIRWYALAYAVGLLAGWRYVLLLNRRRARLLDDRQVDDLLIWMTLGVVLGGRIGYVVFYNAPYYLAHPLAVLYVWHGGMSFHGGVIGVVLAICLFARRNAVGILRLADLVIPAVPIGLFFGRLANFINAELYGRPTDVAWAMAFPTDPDRISRHPSQLYEAALEGLLLFAVLAWMSWRADALKRPGLASGAFLAGYALARGVAELFREPDPQIGFLPGGVTMGQLLSLPMLLVGAALIAVAWRRASATP